MTENENNTLSRTLLLIYPYATTLSPVHLDMCHFVPLDGFFEKGKNHPAYAGSVIFSRTDVYHGSAWDGEKERQY